MLSYSTLRMLAFATLTLLATSCEQEEVAPQPQPTEPVLIKPDPSRMHTVAIRYYLEALGDTFQLPTISPNIMVDYERVVAQGGSAYKLQDVVAQHQEQTVTAAPQEAQLPPISTYAEAIKPKITVTIWEDDAVPANSSIGYKAICELLIDGKVVGTTIYAAVAGQNTPLYVITQSEVSH
jgi:hypothetical protein